MLRRNLILIAVFFAAGKLALMLAVLPGYGTPIFPPAGIALGAVLLWGPRMLVGVAVAAFLLNVSGGGISANRAEALRQIVLYVTLTGGACAQAFCGADLIRRFVGNYKALTRSSEILKFLVLGGPVANLISSTVAVMALYFNGMLSREARLFTWWNWWIGDTIGMFVFTTILFVFFAEPRALWRKRRFTVALPLCLVLVLNLVVFLQEAEWERVNLKSSFERSANGLAERIRKSFESHLDSLYALDGLLAHLPIEDRNTFHTATQRWLRRYPGIYDFSWIPRVSFERRKEFVDRARRAGFSNFEIVEPDVNGNVVTAPKRSEYYPSFFVEPYREGETVLGYDQSTSVERWGAMSQARDQGKPVAAGPVKILQNIPRRFSMMVYLPVYRGRQTTVQERRENLRGFVKAVIRLGDIIEASTTTRDAESYRILLQDQGTPSGRVLYSHPPAHDPGLADGDARNAVYWQTNLVFADLGFWLRVSPSEVYWQRHRDQGPWVVLGAGFLMCGLLVAFLLTNTGTSFALERELAQRQKISEQLTINSEELSRSNADLEQFAYVASHDLQEPLRMISSYLTLLERRLAVHLNEETREFMFYALDGAERMRALILDLLEYSRIGRTGGNREVVELTSVLEKVLQNLQLAIEESGAEIAIGPMPSLTVVRAEVFQLFQNLLMNAVKYRSEDRVLRIEISARRDGERWVFGLKDNGIGIAPESVSRIFLVFHRLHPKTKYPGTGIGLAICKKIVERYRGKIWVESEPDVGSTFFFTLPADPPSSEKAATSSMAEGGFKFQKPLPDFA